MLLGITRTVYIFLVFLAVLVMPSSLFCAGICGTHHDNCSGFSSCGQCKISIQAYCYVHDNLHDFFPSYPTCELLNNGKYYCSCLYYDPAYNPDYVYVKSCVCGHDVVNDTDGDGVNNNVDPDPDNASCPASAEYTPIGGYKCGENCQYIEYKDKTGTCGNITFVNDSSCPSDFDSSQCDLLFVKTDETYTYDQLLTQYSQGSIISPEGNSQTLDDFSVVYVAHQIQDLQETLTGGISGQSSYEQIQDPDLKVVGDYLAGVQQNTGSIVQALEGISQQLETLSKNQQALSQIGLGSSASSGSSEDISELIGEGQVNALTDSDFDTSIETPEDYEQIENENFSFISDFVSNLPIVSAFSQSGVQISSSSCRLSTSLFGREVALDFCNDTIVNTLDFMGSFLVLIANFLFFLIVFRA